ncbi:conserved Plasmodium protein, unknown function [Plasmodium sp. DRC-Itaito]|nr:conserved Plasmodium protein, unknown function [Plasmodium sp. DRC-Itaito]
MHFFNKKGHFNCVKTYKNNIKTIINNKKKGDDYLFMNKIKYKEKKKICFKNIFLSVCVVNFSIFSFTLYNYFKKNDENYFVTNEITAIDHFVLYDFITTLGVNNISIYLKNKFYEKLFLNIQNEEYIPKQNSLLGLIETIYKNKKNKIKLCNDINRKNDNIKEEQNKQKDYYINETYDDINNNTNNKNISMNINNKNISMNINMYNKNIINNAHYDPFIYFLFENIKNNNINHTKKKILSSILFYYITYSQDYLYISYDQILQLVYNPNLFYNLNNREEIISYLLLKILKNETCTDQIYLNEKDIIHKYIQMKKKKKTNHTEAEQNDSIDISKDEKHMEGAEDSIISFLLNNNIEEKEKNVTSSNYNNNNKNNIDSNFFELPIYKWRIYKLYKSFKKNEENYYKQQGLEELQKYLYKINSTYIIENNNKKIIKEKYNNIMNKIYWKFFENTIFYTFLFSFVLHNINSKEYNIKTYIYMFKDIYKSIYTNILINSSFLIQKSILNNINENKQTNKFILTSLSFNIFNSFILSLSIYRCKYGNPPKKIK